jgi:hypothetical protein
MDLVFNFLKVLNKMSKRKRETDIKIGNVDTDGFAAIELDGRVYSWRVPEHINVKPLNDNTKYMISIIHTEDGRAMVEIIDLRMEERVICQVINPWHKRFTGDWAIDE